MRCKDCKSLNFNSANFCYKCGSKFSKNKFSFKNFTYKSIIFSKNKHRNIFILLSVFVLCSALSVSLCRGVHDSFCTAMELVNMSSNQKIAKYVLKGQTELYFRDTFLRVILILFFWCALVLDVIILFYSYALKKREEKNKNMY